MTPVAKPSAELANVLRERPDLWLTPSEREQRRTAALAGVNQALVAGVRRRRLRLGAAVAVPLATAAAVVVWLTTAPGTPLEESPRVVRASGTVLLKEGSRTQRLSPGSHLDDTSELTTLADGEAELELRRAWLTLRPGSHAVLPAAKSAGLGQEIGLLSGAVSLRVNPLPAGEQLVVNTPDATVSVHGTSFDVSVDPRRDPQTCVRVLDGVVSVRFAGGSTLLTAGGAWGCAGLRAGAALPAPSVERVTPVSSGGVAPAPSSAAAAPSRLLPRPAGDTVMQEVELLKSALAAERRGDDAGAEALLRTFLARYPRSELALEANEALERVRGHKGPAR